MIEVNCMLFLFLDWNKSLENDLKVGAKVGRERKEMVTKTNVYKNTINSCSKSPDWNTFDKSRKSIANRNYINDMAY